MSDYNDFEIEEIDPEDYYSISFPDDLEDPIICKGKNLNNIN